MSPSGKTVLVTAYAKAPQGTSMYEQYKHAGIVLEVETATHRVVDVEFTFVTALARDFVRRCLVGYSLRDEVDQMVAVLSDRYMAPSREAVIVALRAAAQRYSESGGQVRIETFQRGCAQAEGIYVALGEECSKRRREARMGRSPRWWLPSAGPSPRHGWLTCAGS